MRLAGLVLVLGAMLAGCTGAQPHRALPALVVGEPSFFPTLEAYAAAPIVGGNQVEILLNGEQIFPAVLEAIVAARRTISYAQPLWDEGPVAGHIATALAERCRAGVGVNILLDGADPAAMRVPSAELLRRSGCHVAHFRAPGEDGGGRRNHRRILVVDGHIGFTGGSGVSRLWMGNGRIPGHWRDTDVRIEGPAVEHLQAAFAESWLYATGIVLGGPAYFPRPRAARGTVYVQVVRSSPAAGMRAMYTTLLLAVASAQRSISITNPALSPDGPLTEALLEAARRGVRVAALVPGEGPGGRPWSPGRARLRALEKAGVEIHAYQPARLHARTIVIDQVWATIGSLTLDHRTFGTRDEVNLIVYSASVARRLEQAFQDDLRHARPLGASADRRSADPRSAGPGQLLDGGAPARGDEPVDGEHDDRADHGHDEPGRITLAIQADGPPQPPADQRADDAEDDGHDDPPRIAPRHDEASHEAHDEAEHDPQQNVHRRTPFAGHTEPRASDDGRECT